MIHWFVKGGPVMWPLLLCSVVAGGVILERLLFWARERRARDPQTVNRLLHMIERGAFDEATAAAQGSQDPIVRVMAHGLTHHYLSLQGALEVAANAELRRVKQYLAVLDTIITVAPLLGIFGTVTGILGAFGALEGRIPDPRVVSAGIAEAVITTVAGLAIAIPTVIAYNIFGARVEDVVGELSSHITNLDIVYRKGRQQRTRAGTGVELPGEVGA